MSMIRIGEELKAKIHKAMVKQIEQDYKNKGKKVLLEMVKNKYGYTIPQFLDLVMDHYNRTKLK